MEYLEKLEAKRNGNWSKWRGNRKAQGERYREKYKDRLSANVKIRNLVMIGKIIKPEKCEECSKEELLNGHHEDYNKPLEVRWLCQDCHNEAHGRFRKII